MSAALLRLELPDQIDDADLLAQVKRSLREADQATALIISGSFAGDISDLKVHGDAISLLLDASIPVFALPSGQIGQQGLALLLAADRVVLGPEASLIGDWRTCPAAVPLLCRRLGYALTNSVAFDPSADLLSHLVDHGHATRSDRSDAYLQEIADVFADGNGRRLKRALKASTELPLKEALSFSHWLVKPEHTSAS
jgi:enoyl-CoA hydratase/carnithine racemase